MNDKTHWSERVKELYKVWTREGIPEYRSYMLEMITFYMSFFPEWDLLDAGCGNGLVFEYLPEEFRERYYGIDFTPEMIDYCRNKYPEYENRFRVCDIAGISINVSDRDIVITQNVLQHILIYQIALDNLLMVAQKLIMFCERTHNDESLRIGKQHKGFTVLAGRCPERWRFNEDDFLDTLRMLGKRYDYEEPEVLAHPRSTDNLLNVLAVYRMKKRGLFRD